LNIPGISRSAGAKQNRHCDDFHSQHFIFKFVISNRFWRF
jgi:hypothetical protein